MVIHDRGGLRIQSTNSCESNKDPGFIFTRNETVDGKDLANHLLDGAKTPTVNNGRFQLPTSTGERCHQRYFIESTMAFRFGFLVANLRLQDPG